MQFAVGVQGGELFAQGEGGVVAHARLHRGIDHAGSKADDAHAFGGSVGGMAVKRRFARAVNAPAGIGFARRAAADMDDAHALAVACVGEDGVGKEQGGGDVEVQRVGDLLVGLRAKRRGGGDGAGVVEKPEGVGFLADVAEGVAAGVGEDGRRVGQIYRGFVQLAGVGGGKG